MWKSPNLTEILRSVWQTSPTSEQQSGSWCRFENRALEVRSHYSWGYKLTANTSCCKGQSLTSLQRLYLISKITQITPNTSIFKGQPASSSYYTWCSFYTMVLHMTSVRLNPSFTLIKVNIVIFLLNGSCSWRLCVDRLWFLTSCWSLFINAQKKWSASVLTWHSVTYLLSHIPAHWLSTKRWKQRTSHKC